MIALISILALLLLIQGIVSAAQGFRFAGFVRRSLGSPLAGSVPSASIIAPVKGLDPGLEHNIQNLFNQNYPDYEIIFVVAEPGDTAAPIIRRAVSENTGCRSRLITAGPAAGRSEKVNNLLHGVAAVSPRSEVLVFVDSDAQVGPDWLRGLIGALDCPGAGASTGYRWYFPATGGFWSMLVSAWNASILTTLGDHARNFVWGGSTAIRCDTFARIRVADHWERALSDDYALTRAVREAGLRIIFVPRCLTPTIEDFGIGSALEFTRRQVTIARVYEPSAWWIGFTSHSLFVAGFFGGIGAAIYELAAGGRGFSSVSIYTPGLSIGALILVYVLIYVLIYILGLLKAWLRLQAAALVLPEMRSQLAHLRMTFLLLWPLVALLFFYDFAASTMTRKIKWRGVWYEMRSPAETIVLDRE